MRESLIAQRSAQAQAQIVAAVTALAAGSNLDVSGLAVTARDPAIQSMLRWEALAVVLASLPTPSVAPVTAPSPEPTKSKSKG